MVARAGLGCVAMASLAWRRRTPLLVTVLVVAANLVINPQGEFSTLLSLVLVCFTVGYETKPPAPTSASASWSCPSWPCR